MAQLLSPQEALARAASLEKKAARRHRHTGLSAQARLARARQQRALAGVALFAKQQTFQQASAQRQSVALRQSAARRMYLAQSLYSRQQFIIKGLTGIRSSRALRLATSKYPLSSFWAIPYRRQLGLSGARSRAASSATAVRKAATTKNRALSGRRHKPRMAPVTTSRPPGHWITAGNDEGAPNCASVAIANHLLAATGIRLAEEEVTRFSAWHDGDLWQALCVMRLCQPWRDRAVLTTARDAEALAAGQVWGVTVPEGPHAVASSGEALIVSWGGEVPFTGQVEEAYELAWTVASPHRTRKL